MMPLGDEEDFMMIKKIFPLLLIALLMFAPASFAADDGGELLSRDM